jgi:hypothetical protein
MTLSIAVGTNSYISLADAETYVERLYGPRRDAWDAAATATKNSLLAQATLDIDSQLWRGYKSDEDQALEFPRDGWATTDDEYTLVEQATVEQALYLLSYGQECREAMAAQGVASASVGGVHETLNPGGPSALAPRARRLLRQWAIYGAVMM